MVLRELSPTVLAGGQVQAADLPAIKAAGVTLLVNNRPDGESPDQPEGEQIAKSARELGIAYAAIPVGAGFNRNQIRELGELLTAHKGTALIYCRSGTRSTFLWALAQASAGEPVDRIVVAAEQAGFSLAPIRGALDALAAQAGG